MTDQFDQLAEIVLAIKEDPKLVECFVRVLKLGSSTQQVRAANLKAELEQMGAPAEVIDFVRLLSNDKVAHIVLQEIQRED